MRVIVYGAGQVGRGLIGRIFCNTGHRVVFVEKQMEITRRLQMNSYYPLQTGRGLQWVGPVVALMPGGEQEELRDADLIVCCVRVENLKDVASSIQNVIFEKAPTILIVENMPNAVSEFRKMLRANGKWQQGNIYQGIAECIIPEVDPDVQLLDPALMNGDENGYLVMSKELQGRWGRVRGIEFVGDMDFAWNIKWFQHCAFHAVLGYVGLARGMTYIDEVVNDEDLYVPLNELSNKIVDGLNTKFPNNPDQVWQRMFNERLGLASPIIRDVCARVTRDPARKVAPGERLRDLETLVGGHSLVTEAIQQAERMAGK